MPDPPGLLERIEVPRIGKVESREPIQCFSDFALRLHLDIRQANDVGQCPQDDFRRQLVGKTQRPFRFKQHGHGYKPVQPITSTKHLGLKELVDRSRTPSGVSSTTNSVRDTQ